MWQQRLHTWALTRRLLCGSVDSTLNHVIEQLCFCLALYTGSCAQQFPGTLTPWQYFTATACFRFVEKHSFCGYADDEPVEFQHADGKAHMNSYKHCSSTKLAPRSCIRQTHVRNDLGVHGIGGQSTACFFCPFPDHHLGASTELGALAVPVIAAVCFATTRAERILGRTHSQLVPSAFAAQTAAAAVGVSRLPA